MKKTLFLIFLISSFGISFAGNLTRNETGKTENKNAENDSDLTSSVRMLSLNNSLIYYNDQPVIFENIAESMGYTASWVAHTLLGQSLQAHWEEGDDITVEGVPSAKALVRSEPWSHIILQEYSWYPQYEPEQFFTNIGNWVEYIRENCPNPDVEIILPLNWAYYIEDYEFFRQDTEVLIGRYQEMATKYDLTICPIGLAYEMKFADDGSYAIYTDWFLGEEIHPTIASSYLAALMEFGLIFNASPLDVEYFPQEPTQYDINVLTPEMAEECRQYAYKALLKFSESYESSGVNVSTESSLNDNRVYDLSGRPVNPSRVSSGIYIKNGRKFILNQEL